MDKERKLNDDNDDVRVQTNEPESTTNVHSTKKCDVPAKYNDNILKFRFIY